ncbi:MAG TPA: Gfo/Idh/MocA family oxidoreductase [Dongiaceae bacterium]|jgi:predicted dehydrogenase|nr:Gfo/Idh/MocA family oxidoreductase [Dongiaceae bacterium]
MERTALAVVGCGFFAQNHLHAWMDLAPKGVEIVAVCDIDEAKARATADKFGVKHWYTDAETLFREHKLDLVDIVTRVETHRDVVGQAIRRRVPTIVQKPFGPDLAACRAMADEAQKAGVFLAVHENFRFQVPMRKITELLRAGAIGTPSWGRVSFRTGYDIYKGQPYLAKEERFVLIDLGVHVLDLARVLLGEVEHLSAELQRRNPNVSGEDTATMLLKHRSGAVSIVECTYESRRMPDLFPETLLEIEGPKGAIILKPGSVLDVTIEGKTTTHDVDAPVLRWAERPWHIIQESVLATCEHILGALRAGRPADTSALDNVRTFGLVEASYEAASSGRSVRFA